MFTPSDCKNQIYSSVHRLWSLIDIHRRFYIYTIHHRRFHIIYILSIKVLSPILALKLGGGGGSKYTLAHELHGARTVVLARSECFNFENKMFLFKFILILNFMLKYTIIRKYNTEHQFRLTADCNICSGVASPKIQSRYGNFKVLLSFICLEINCFHSQ